MTESPTITPMLNPFRDAIVANPWGPPIGEVDSIHQAVFNRCLQGVEQVRASRRSASLLIHGQAGAGKTHLLRRLRIQLEPHLPSATHRPESLFVWVRLQTSPRMIWRTVRRALVDDWFRRVTNLNSQFERILFHRLAEKRPAEGDLERWYEYMLQEHPESLSALIYEIAGELDLDHNTAVAFEHIAFRRHNLELRAWLAGDSLSDASLTRLGLTQDEQTDEDREHQSRIILKMLCRLAGPALPIVLCFDQVEALQLVPGDTDGLFAFGQMVSTLHDETENVLLVSCMQSSFLDDLNRSIRSADRDRLTSLSPASLDPLQRPQALLLIADRLKRVEDAQELPSPRAECWPLGQAEFETLLRNGEVIPRTLLSRCAIAWQNRDGSPSRDVVNTESPKADSQPVFPDSLWDTTFEQAMSSNRPDQTDAILQNGLPVWIWLATREYRREECPQSDVTLLMASGTSRVPISVCVSADMRSLASRFRRLRTEQSQSRLSGLVIIRDERIPLTDSAKKAKEYLAELQQNGARVIQAEVTALAGLESLTTLLIKAKTGELTIDGETLPVEIVEQWLVENLPTKCPTLVELQTAILNRQTTQINTSAVLVMHTSVTSPSPSRPTPPPPTVSPPTASQPPQSSNPVSIDPVSPIA